jgi:5-methylthioadenosine/S-adenosylhomocysteine deaminase
VYEASLLGNAEMISRGITAVVDMYYFEGEVARAVRESGLRGWLGQTVIDFKAPDFATPDESLQYTEAEMRRWQNDALVKIIPAPHSGYTCSPETLRRTKELAARLNSPLTFHLSESASEVADIRDRYGVTPTEHAARIGLLGRRVLAAHCVQLTPADLDLLQQSGTAVAHNPDSNLKLASGLAPVAEMRRRGIPVGLGTDGAASNNRLDLFHAMDLAAKIHKFRENDPTAMTAREVVRMATVDGAAAIGADKLIGSLETGKKADLIVLDLGGPAYQPVHNIYSHLVYVAHGEAVTGTMVAGRWLMKDRRLLTLDPKRLAGLALEHRRQIRLIVEGRP